MRNLLLISMLLVACSHSKTNEIPSYVLPQKKMIDVLTDLHLLKAKVAVWRIKLPVSQNQEDSLFQQLYSEHELTQSSLDSSMSYYIHHEPLMLEDIYAKVLEGLQLQEVNLGN